MSKLPERLVEILEQADKSQNAASEMMYLYDCAAQEARETNAHAMRMQVLYEAMEEIADIDARLAAAAVAMLTAGSFPDDDDDPDDDIPEDQVAGCGMPEKPEPGNCTYCA